MIIGRKMFNPNRNSIDKMFRNLNFITTCLDVDSISCSM